MADRLNVNIRTVQKWEERTKDVRDPIRKSIENLRNTVINEPYENLSVSDVLADYSSEASQLRTEDPKQLLRIYLEYVANKDELMKFKRMRDEKEIEFLEMYIKIKEEYGSIDRYLSEKV